MITHHTYRTFTVTILPVFAALFTCCVEPFYLDLDRETGNYVVEAVMLDDSRFQYVKLFRLEQENELRIRQELVTDAHVTLEKAPGEIFTLFINEEGTYLPSEYLTLNTGDKYRLTIHVNENEVISSGWEQVPEKVNLEEGYWERTSSTFFNHNGIPVSLNGFNFKINTTAMPTEDVSLRWEYETTHINEAPYASGLCVCRNCYIKSTPAHFVNAVRIINSKQKPLLDHHIEFIRLDKRFSFRLTMLVRQICHTASAGVYYDFVQQQQQVRGTIFDPPPSIIKGNLQMESDMGREAYGLFELGRLDELSITVFRGEFEAELVTYAAECEQKRFEGIYEPGCNNCRAEPGVGPRPYYF